MKCPFCSFTETKVVDSRISSNGTSIRRRRHCLSCNKRFTTYEKVDNITVIKRDGSRESFDESKILKGLLLATEKRNLSQDILENIVTRIQKELEDTEKSEITSLEIGKMVMSKLKEIDPIAYLRFASVYKDFKDIKNFLEEIEEIKK